MKHSTQNYTHNKGHTTQDEYKQSQLQCSTHGGEEGGYRICLGKPQEERTLGRPRRRWEENIETDLREIGWGGMEWIHLAQERDQRTLVNTEIDFRVP
jgi:hypothetical protein